MRPPEVIEVDADVEIVACDGGGAALGHPVVYYPVGEDGVVDCGYCGRRFVRAGTAAARPVDREVAAEEVAYDAGEEKGVEAIKGSTSSTV